MMKLKVPMAVPILLLEKRCDQEQVQSEPKDCPQKQKCEITKIT